MKLGTQTIPDPRFPNETETEAKDLETPDWRAPCKYGQTASFSLATTGAHSFDKTTIHDEQTALFCTRCGATRVL